MKSEKNGLIATEFEDLITWVRASEAFTDNPFWGSDGITPMDVH